MAQNIQQELGKTLWSIANNLRGAMMADDFRDYMLSFLFWKYLSDNYIKSAQKELGADYAPLQIWYDNNPDDTFLFEKQMKRKIHYVIEPKYRSTATGLMFAIAFVLGSFSPWILAILEKQYEGDFGPGLSMLAWVYVGSALLVLISMVFFYNRDRNAAEKNLE